MAVSAENPNKNCKKERGTTSGTGIRDNLFWAFTSLENPQRETTELRVPPKD